MVQSFGSPNLMQGYAEGTLAMLLCVELGISSLSCAVTQQVRERSFIVYLLGTESDAIAS